LSEEAKESAKDIIVLLARMKAGEACVISKEASRGEVTFVFEDPRKYLLALKRKMDRKKGQS